MYENIRFISGGRFISRGEWLHPQRIIDSHEVILVLKGEVHIASGETAYTLRAGDMLRLEPGIPHRGTAYSREPVSFYWLHFIGAAREELPAVFRHLEDAARAELLYRQLLHYANTGGYPHEITDCFVRILLMELGAQQTDSTSANALCAEIKEWVRVNCDLPIKVSDAAAHFRYNPDYLNRVFRRYHPEGLKAYINAARMQRIKKDLTAGELSLQDIAHKYAFGDYKYFLKYFKFHEGVTPTAYRLSYYNTHINNT